MVPVVPVVLDEDDVRSGSLYSLRGFYPRKEDMFNSYRNPDIYAAFGRTLYYIRVREQGRGVITVRTPSMEAF